MQRARTTTQPSPRRVGPDAQEWEHRSARAWVKRRLRWEDRLAELRALADPGDTTARCVETRRMAQSGSGVLERPGRSAGVRA
jgi:hypothetical protein